MLKDQSINQIEKRDSGYMCAWNSFGKIKTSKIIEGDILIQNESGWETVAYLVFFGERTEGHSYYNSKIKFLGLIRFDRDMEKEDLLKLNLSEYFLEGFDFWVCDGDKYREINGEQCANYENLGRFDDEKTWEKLKKEIR